MEECQLALEPGLGCSGWGIGGESDSQDLSSCFFEDQRSDDLS